MSQFNLPRQLPWEPAWVAGKKIVVSGGTKGIGRATALLLAAQGARVLIFGRHEQELNDALRDIEAAGGEVYGVAADQARTDDIERVFREADAKLGGVDVLVNNAALGGGSVTEIDAAEIRYVVDTNLTGYLVCAQQAVQRMQQAGGGHVINIGSISANERGSGSEVYVATKAAIQALSESLRKQVAADGIKVTLIEPGSVGTDMSESSPGEQRQQQRELKQLQAEDLAACVYYCLIQPPRCNIMAINIQPLVQE